MCCRSSFHGVIAEIPGVIVDNFLDIGSHVRAYFLSHCHTDHTAGLMCTELLTALERNKTYLYMSELTAEVILQFFSNDCNRDRLSKFIKVLKLGENTVTLRETGQEPEIFLGVTVITAGHCFGSNMFLFRTPLKTVLYTGDFRISYNDVEKFNQLHVNGDPIHIDALYVDTTFQGESYSEFPKRSDSVEEAISEIQKWLGKGKDRAVGLHTSANFGYEQVFNEIHTKLGIKVYVNEKKWEFYRNFLDLVPGVTNDATVPIHVCRNRHETTSHNGCFSGDFGSQRPYQHYLFVHFSAMLWKDRTDGEMTRSKENRIDVCYATHCSRKELRYFINYFAPDKVEGFPGAYNPGSPLKREGKRVEATPKKRVGKDGGAVDRIVDSKRLKAIFD